MSNHCSNYNTNPSAKSLRILVVDDDLTCLTIVAAILKKWNYEVVTIKHPIDALCILRITHGGFDLVIIDVHMPQMNGFELLKLVNEEFKLPVVLMSADDKEAIMVKAIERGAEFFIVKPITPDDVRGLWQYTAAHKKIHEATSKNSIIFPGKSLTYSTPEKYDQLQTKRIHKKKSSRKVSLGDDKEDINFSRSTVVEGKKGKVVWTNALHDKFLLAIRTIGLQNAVPKKILEIMDVPGLTRENVASHLQKYRIFLHRVSDLSFGMQFQWRTNMSKKSFQSNSLSGSRPDIMHNKLIPSYKEIYEAEPPVLDTSRELGNTSFPVLETSSYKTTTPSGSSMKVSEPRRQETWESMTNANYLRPNSANNASTALCFCNSAYTSIGSSSNDSSPMQNAFDAVVETTTVPKTLGNGGIVGEDDSVFDSMDIYSPSLDTIFSHQAYADYDDLGSLFVNQSDEFPSLNQLKGGEEELGIFDYSSLASKQTGNASAADKILNEQQKPAKEAMAAGSIYNGNNQYPNGYSPVVNPNCSQDNGDEEEEDFLDSMFGPGPPH